MDAVAMFVEYLTKWGTLTGSRRFIKRTDTDWDFVVDGSTTTAKNAWEWWLTVNGFDRVWKDYGGKRDDDTLGIWRREIQQPGSFTFDIIEVNLSKDYAGKKRIIEWLDKRPALMEAYYKTDKKERHLIWEYLHRLKEQGKI